jgi:fructose-bisphosphate aldolase class II
MQGTAELVRNAWTRGIVVPAFNVPYLPMVEPVIRAIVDQDAFALIESARLEWLKFESQGPAAVKAEFDRWHDPAYVRLHLDHVPAIDEDNLEVDCASIVGQAIALGFDSVMVDGSRLDLEDNIRVSGQVVEMAHTAGIPCEAELGAVLGHEAGPLPPYEELFRSGRGFTRAEEAERFVAETGCDWLSVAAGNIHGAISGAWEAQEKIETRLDIAHLQRLRQATGIPLVLHGGTGIQREYLMAAVDAGIAKVNVASEIRRAYEGVMRGSGITPDAQQAVYDRTCWLLRDHFGVAGRRAEVMGED